MKNFFAALLILVSALVFTPTAKAWNCTDPLASRVDVGSTKPSGTAGDGDGQYYIGSDASNPHDYYVCQVPKPTPPASTPSTSNSSSSASAAASSTSNSSASSNQSQSQKQNQNQTATGGAGGNASATGGNASATGGSVSNSGNSSSKSGVSNSGNSSNRNTNTATGGNQSQSSTSSANGNGVGNGNNSNDTTIKEVHQTPTAFAPNVYGANTCFKGGSISASGGLFSFGAGGGRIDDNCADLEASRLAPSILARCKIFIQNKYAKEAGVSLDDCLPQPIVVVAPAPVAVVAPAPAPAISVTVPVTFIPAPVVAPAPSIVVAAAATHHKSRVPCEPVTVPSGKKGCVVTNSTITQ